MASLLVYLSTALLALFVYYGFKLYGSYKKRMALWKHYDQTPGFSPLAPLPHHWFFSQIASWINQEDRAKGLGLRVSKLHEWAKLALNGADEGKLPADGSMPPKFLRLQFFADWFPLASHALFAMDADIVKDMFNSAAESAVIKGNSYRLAYPLIGDGILALPMNEKWKTQRRLTEHAFRLENLKYSHAQINKVLVRMLDRWNARYAASKAAGTSDSLTSLPSDPALAKKQGWFDIRHDMLRVTMDIICQVGFGRDYEAGAEKEHLLQQERETFTAVSLKSKLEGPEASKDGEPLYRVFNEILVKMANRARILPFAYMFTEDDRAYKQRFALLDKVVGRMVDARLEKVRRGDTSRDGTLLDAIADIGEDGQPIMSRKQAFDELKTFLFAGHDTTGNALTWCFFHLATDPEALRKLRHEADHVLPRATSYSDLERAPYLNNFIKEILRLHPSAGFTRLVTAEEGVTLGGINVPKNSEIFFIPTLIMQQERYYERALEFIPERWEEGSSLKMDNRAYYPFSLGPRNCIGMKLAQLELRCILVEVVRRWDIVYDGEKGAPGTYLSMTLDPSIVMVRAVPRSDKDARMWGDNIELAEG